MMTSGFTPEVAWSAYSNGGFCMGGPDGRLDWYRAVNRCLIPIEGMHVSRSLRRVLARAEFRVTFDEAFEGVVRGCLRPHDNWITEQMIAGYLQIHAQGWAHSSEVWLGDFLAGGVFGLAIGGCFSAESMFSRVSNASKVALFHLIEKCRGLGFELFDAQLINDHTASLGAFEIPGEAFHELLARIGRQTNPWTLPANHPFRLQSDTSRRSSNL